jgi:hypothetical protein
MADPNLLDAETMIVGEGSNFGRSSVFEEGAGDEGEGSSNGSDEDDPPSGTSPRSVSRLLDTALVRRTIEECLAS